MKKPLLLCSGVTTYYGKIIALREVDVEVVDSGVIKVKGEDGEKVAVTAAWDSEEEARVIGEEIEALQRQGHSLDEMAILVRASFQMREFEDRFVTLGLPYRVIGGPRFYERAEIRDALDAAGRHRVHRVLLGDGEPRVQCETLKHHRDRRIDSVQCLPVHEHLARTGFH